MKRTHKIIAGLILAAGIGSVAFAQGGPGSWGCDGAGPMGKRASMRFDPAQRAEQRLNYFKDQLKLTAEQEPLWQAFAEKAKSEAGQGMRAMRDQAGDLGLTAPERMAKMQKLMQERVDAMAGVHENFNRLYGALTPEQKRVADQYAAQMGKGSMGGKAGGRMGPAGYGPGRMAPPPAPQG
jgi:hypothetical protein